MVYGLTRNIDSYNPVVIGTHELVDIARDVADADDLAGPPLLPAARSGLGLRASRRRRAGARRRRLNRRHEAAVVVAASSPLG